MTPIEHRALQAVETLLRQGQRASLPNITALLKKAPTQVSRYFRRFAELGYFRSDPLYLRVFTEVGWAAYQRGPDEPDRAPGQKIPKNSFTRPMFEVLRMIVTTGDQPTSYRMRTNPHLAYVRLFNVIHALQCRGLLELVKTPNGSVWSPTRAAIEHLRIFEQQQHPWWIDPWWNQEERKESA